MSWQDWKKWPCHGETGGNYCDLVRLEEIAMPWRGWRKWPCLGETRGNDHALSRLEDMAMPPWLCLGDTGRNGHPRPTQVLLQGGSIFQGRTLFLGFAVIAYHMQCPSLCASFNA